MKTSKYILFFKFNVMKITKVYILEKLQDILDDKSGNDDMFNDIERLMNEIEKDFK